MESVSSVPGTYKESLKSWWLPVAFGAPLAFVVWAFASAEDWPTRIFRSLYPVAIALMSFLYATGNRTVIAPEGVRVKGLLRWRAVAWQDVTAVEGPGRWDLQPSIKLATPAGTMPLISVPVELLEPLRAYAETQRPSPAP